MLSGATNIKRRKSSSSENESQASSASCQSQSTVSGKSVAKRFCSTNVVKEEEKATSSNAISEEMRLARVRAIIEREFQHEINCKKQQLLLISERLEQARILLDKVRYVAIADFYQSQEPTLSAKELTALRDEQTLFDNEPDGPQKSLHPAVQRLINKKPAVSTLTNDLFRSCPQRMAAKNAKFSLRAKTQAERREERRLHDLIKNEGIVIDHSKQQTLQECMQTIKVEPVASASEDHAEQTQNAALMQEQQAQNFSRPNDKNKYLIVVGNTSRYIGAELKNSSEKTSEQNTNFLYKWLVYVQAKDATTPIETFLRKVRFQLHPSYRPNDIIDIDQTPFQIARRGWGEFPMRIQLFFHDIFKQKPIQLVHNVVLDRTLSGKQTLGSETVLEVWLSSKMVLQSPVKTLQNLKSENIQDCNMATSTAKRSLSFSPHEDDIDDNLFEFLKKIEETPTSISADIEEIQPTISVSETLTTKSPDKVCSNKAAENSAITATQSENQSKNISNKLNSNVQVPATIAANTTIKSGVMFLPTAALKNSLPASTIEKPKAAAPANIVGTFKNGTQKLVFEKKLVQLVDGQGNIKFVQMLIAAKNPVNNAADNKEVLVQNQIKSKTADYSETTQSKGTVITKPIENSASQANVVQTQLTKPLKTAESNQNYVNVFQKEGKLFIVDPKQMRLKQQQKTQVSLLKPQISLLKRNNQTSGKSSTTRVETVAFDHNYTPATKQEQADLAKTSFSDSALHSNSRMCTEQTEQTAQMQQCAQFELKFKSINFENMRAAVEYLFRRLPLIAAHGSIASCHAFSRRTLKEFQELPAFKQRACEWLRAKYISRLLATHLLLQKLHETKKEILWTTREVASFGRCYAYTPAIKCLHADNKVQTNEQQFSQMVKEELRNEQLQYETLSENAAINSWLQNVWPKLQQHENTLLESEIIDVIGCNEQQSNKCDKKRNPPEMSFDNFNTKMLLLPAPKKLENELQLLSDISKDINLHLQAEVIENDVLFPAAQTVLAHSLHIFVEKLLRQTLAERCQHKSLNALTQMGEVITLTALDIGKGIEKLTEFDFLSNKQLGIMREAEEIEKEAADETTQTAADIKTEPQVMNTIS